MIPSLQSYTSQAKFRDYLCWVTYASVSPSTVPPSWSPLPVGVGARNGGKWTSSSYRRSDQSCNLDKPLRAGCATGTMLSARPQHWLDGKINVQCAEGKTATAHSVRSYSCSRSGSTAIPSDIAHLCYAGPDGNIFVPCADRLVHRGSMERAFQSNPIPNGAKQRYE